jgi:hypothetical protein
MPLFRFVLRDGAQVRDTASLSLSDEGAAREVAERLALAVARRRPASFSQRFVVVTDSFRQQSIEVVVPPSAAAGGSRSR